MPDIKPDQEPSIEEILESIRQIISDDTEVVTDKPAKQEAQAPEPEEEPYVPPTPAHEPEIETSNVVDLTEVVSEPVFEIDMQEAREKETPYMAATDTQEAEGSLLSDIATAATADAMAKLLANNVAIERDEPSRIGRVTLEDMARELMRPLIKSWLDQNLPAITEKIVAREIEKISRRAADR